MRLTCRESDLGRVIAHPQDAASVLLPMCLPDRETLTVMCLDARRRVINAFVLATGTATEVACEPRDLFRPVLLLDAHAILIAHNHPNGDPTPSEADILTTKTIELICRVLGVQFIDHLVLTASGRYRSIAEYMEIHGR